MWSNIGSCPQVPVGTIGKELILWECQQSWALGMRQHFNTQNRHGPNPEYNCVILVFVAPRMSTRLVKSMK
jgi:hypothetical protein